MSDFYTEQLVKRKATSADMAKRVGLIVLTVASVAAIFLVPFGILAPVIMIVLDIFLFKRFNVEYEYLYVNGDLDIDKIMSKEKRKKIFSMHISELEVLAPTGDPELRPFQNVKAVNYSSLEPNHKTYEMVIVQNGQKSRIIFEPNATIVEGMRMLAPRKVTI